MSVQQVDSQPAAAGAATRVRAANAGGGRAGRDAGWIPYAFLAPYLVLFTAFVLVPAIYGLWISLHNWDFLLANRPFVGLENYAALFREGTATGNDFWQSMWATAQFTLYSVPLLLVLPLGVALVLNRRFPGRAFFRAVYFAPYVLGVAVVGVLWRFMLDPEVGLINYLLGLVGLPDNTPWMTQMPWAWIALVGMTVWWTLGFNAVIYLAGLQEIDRTLYEAARVDGASRWKQFVHVTLPGLRRVLLFVTTVTVLASANMFGQSYLVTEGNPANQTRTAIMFIAEEGFAGFRMGSAAAMSYVLALFLAAISIGIFAFFNRLED